MPIATRHLEDYGISIDEIGNVVSVDHEPETQGVCPFHNPSISPLVFAPIRYTAAAGLVRVCEHGKEHPDFDDRGRLASDLPMFVKTVEVLHDKSCDGCCVDSEPITKSDEPGTHRADTQALSLTALREVQERVAASTGVLPVHWITPDASAEPTGTASIPVAVEAPRPGPDFPMA